MVRNSYAKTWQMPRKMCGKGWDGLAPPCLSGLAVVTRCAPLHFTFAGLELNCDKMDLSELTKSCQQLWEKKPGVFLLLILGFVVFVFLVVDAWRHKRRRRRPR
jgi:hypothetical protein